MKYFKDVVFCRFKLRLLHPPTKLKIKKIDTPSKDCKRKRFSEGEDMCNVQMNKNTFSFSTNREANRKKYYCIYTVLC